MLRWYVSNYNEDPEDGALYIRTEKLMDELVDIQTDVVKRYYDINHVVSFEEFLHCVEMD